MNVMVTPKADDLSRRLFTVEDAFRMVETGIIGPDERLELIEGEFVRVNSKNNFHQSVQNRLTKALIRAVPDDLAVGIEPTLKLDDFTFVEPDIVLYRYSEAPRLTADRAMLVIEISDSSLGFDLGPKARLMAQAGVTDYWVINAQSLEVTIHREPRADGYGSIRRLGRGETLSPIHPDLTAVALRLADLV
ncbi:Uma2 family endonuclease [Phreatobacter sp.]|uniref:Uma2 family endonuclease n=1 Tax=Phreatobacter sp. TaxID=1966341 RepID=UPI003F6EF8D5